MIVRWDLGPKSGIGTFGLSRNRAGDEVKPDTIHLGACGVMMCCNATKVMIHGARCGEVYCDFDGEHAMPARPMYASTFCRLPRDAMVVTPVLNKEPCIEATRRHR